MSVLINGMEMPKTCDECFLPLRYCDYAMKPDGKCPLVPVPPHGRLIDADAMQDEWFRLNFDRKISDGTLAYWNCQLSKMPTIIEAEGGE